MLLSTAQNRSRMVWNSRRSVSFAAATCNRRRQVSSTRRSRGRSVRPGGARANSITLSVAATSTDPAQQEQSPEGNANPPPPNSASIGCSARPATSLELRLGPVNVAMPSAPPRSTAQATASIA